MRMMTLVVIVLMTVACHVTESNTTENRRGEAYARVAEIQYLSILPVKLPALIGGTATPDQLDQFREHWPKLGAERITAQLNAELFLDVDAVTRETAPVGDYYFELVLTRLDVADPDVVAPDPTFIDQDDWSVVEGTGRLMEAGTGELVVELAFRVTSGGGGDAAFEQDMDEIGEQLAGWLERNQR